MKNPFKLLSSLYWHYIATPAEEARHNGVKIGRNCLIDTRHFPSEGYLVSVGDNCQLTNGVRIHTHGGGHIIRLTIPDFDSFGKVTIEDNCYIGAGSQIMPGVTVGAGSLVAAGSIVTKSVPTGHVVGGNPAKVICTTKDYIERNRGYNLKTRGLTVEEKRDFLMGAAENKFVRK